MNKQRTEVRGYCSFKAVRRDVISGETCRNESTHCCTQPQEKGHAVRGRVKGRDGRKDSAWMHFTVHTIIGYAVTLELF